MDLVSKFTKLWLEGCLIFEQVINHYCLICQWQINSKNGSHLLIEIHWFFQNPSGIRNPSSIRNPSDNVSKSIGDSFSPSCDRLTNIMQSDFLSLYN